MRRLLSDLWFDIRYGYSNKAIRFALVSFAIWGVWWVCVNLFLHTHYVVVNSGNSSKAATTTSKMQCYSFAKEKNLVALRNGDSVRITCEPIPKD